MHQDPTTQSKPPRTPAGHDGAPPCLQVPPLAGLATYAAAAAVGYGVEENVALLLRYAWIEKRTMEVGLHWLAPTPEWEIKEALGLHLHLDAEHAAALRDAHRRNAQPCASAGRACLTRRSTVSLTNSWRQRNTAGEASRSVRRLKAGAVGSLPAALRRRQPGGRLSHPPHVEAYPGRRRGGRSLGRGALWRPRAGARTSWRTPLAGRAPGAFLAGAGGIMGTAPRPAVAPALRGAAALRTGFLPAA